MLSIEPGDAAKLVECLTSMWGNPGMGRYVKGVTAPACTSITQEFKFKISSTTWPVWGQPELHETFSEKCVCHKYVYNYNTILQAYTVPSCCLQIINIAQEIWAKSSTCGLLAKTGTLLCWTGQRGESCKNRVVAVLSPSPKKEILCCKHLFSGCHKKYYKRMRSMCWLDAPVRAICSPTAPPGSIGLAILSSNLCRWLRLVLDFIKLVRSNLIRIAF